MLPKQFACHTAQRQLKQRVSRFVETSNCKPGTIHVCIPELERTEERHGYVRTSSGKVRDDGVLSHDNVSVYACQG